MGEKLTDTVEKLNLPEKDKMVMTMFPGILFGFVPVNLDEIEERLDCPSCMAIAEKMKVVISMKMPHGWRYYLPWVRSAWRKQTSDLAQQLFNEVKALEKQDREHWESGISRTISKEFVTAFIKRDDWVS